MKTHMSFRLLQSSFAIALSTISLVGSASATQGGTSTATFLRIGQGARAEGMGGAFTAVADDAHAVYWNPAGLAQITRRQLGLSHLQHIEKVTSQHGSFVLPVNKLNGSLGVQTTFVDMGTIDRRDATGALVGGDNKVSAYSGTVAWGQAFGDRLALGVGAKLFGQDLAGETGSGFAADLGALFFIVPNRFAIGLSALNLGPQIKTGTQNEDIPQTLTVGGAYYPMEQLTIALDLAKERDTDAALHLGGEYLFQGRFVVRAGFQDTQEAGGGLSAGAGFIWRPKQEGSNDFFGKQDGKTAPPDGLDIRFDYAYVDLGDFDETHRVGVHLSF
jgi:hypothetical protein